MAEATVQQIVSQIMVDLKKKIYALEETNL